MSDDVTIPREDAVMSDAMRVRGYANVEPGCLPYVGVKAACDRCGVALVGRQRRWCSEACSRWFYTNHAWPDARAHALKQGGGECSRCGSRVSIEVDHITERKGQPIHSYSCLHHADNLRLLCHPCHVSRKQWEASDD